MKNIRDLLALSTIAPIAVLMAGCEVSVPGVSPDGTPCEFNPKIIHNDSIAICPKGSLLEDSSTLLACDIICSTTRKTDTVRKDLDACSTACIGRVATHKDKCAGPLGVLVQNFFSDPECSDRSLNIDLESKCFDRLSPSFDSFLKCDSKSADRLDFSDTEPVPTQPSTPAAPSDNAEHNSGYLNCFGSLGGKIPGAHIVNTLGPDGPVTIPAPRGKKRGFYAYTPEMAYYFEYPKTPCKSGKDKTSFVVSISLPGESTPKLALLENGVSKSDQKFTSPLPSWAESCKVNKLDGAVSQALGPESDKYIRGALVFALKVTKRHPDQLSSCRNAGDPALKFAVDALNRNGVSSSSADSGSGGNNIKANPAK